MSEQKSMSDIYKARAVKAGTNSRVVVRAQVEYPASNAALAKELGVSVRQVSKLRRRNPILIAEMTDKILKSKESLLQAVEPA